METMDTSELRGVVDRAVVLVGELSGVIAAIGVQAEQLEAGDYWPELTDVDLDDVLSFAEAYAGLGDAVTDQIADLLEGNWNECNPNAVLLIADKLGPLHEEIAVACREARDAFALEHAVAEARVMFDRHGDAIDADAGFDGGEFSGPAHVRAIESELRKIAERHAVTVDDLRVALNCTESGQ